MKDRRLHYVQSQPGGREEHRVASNDEVEPGAHTLEMEFVVTGDDHGSVTLRVDGAEAAQREFPRAVDARNRRHHDWGLCCGRDGGDAVSRDYEAPFPFTGEIERVIVELIDTSGNA